MRLWGTIRFLLYVIQHPQSSKTYMEVLLRLQALGDPAQAFCNFVLFCVCDRTVRRKICPYTCNRVDTLEDHIIDEDFDNA